MKKNIITTTLAAAMVATTILTTGISAQAAEAPAAQTQTQPTKIVLSEASKAALKTLFDAKYYAETYPDIVTVLGNDANVLFNHYITSGINEGRDARNHYIYQFNWLFITFFQLLFMTSCGLLKEKAHKNLASPSNIFFQKILVYVRFLFF